MSSIREKAWNELIYEVFLADEKMGSRFLYRSFLSIGVRSETLLAIGFLKEIMLFFTTLKIYSILELCKI